MQRTAKTGLILLSILFFVACATQSTGQPNWIHNPERNQAVGYCGSHALGKHKQRECAITRARIELAAQQGVILQSVSLTQEHATNQSSSSSLDQSTIQEVNAKVKARVVKSYYDPAQDTLWVLVEED